MNRFRLLPGKEWLICMDSLPFVAKRPPPHPEHTPSLLEPRGAPGLGSLLTDPMELWGRGRAASGLLEPALEEGNPKLDCSESYSKGLISRKLCCCCCLGLHCQAPGEREGDETVMGRNGGGAGTAALTPDLSHRLCVCGGGIRLENKE